MPESVTERDMLRLLRARYNRRSPSGYPRYVYAEHVAHYGSTSEADAIVLDGQEVPQLELTVEERYNRTAPRGIPDPNVHGFEVKISRGDWLREYRTEGAKSWAWRQWYSHWWIVVPDANIVKMEELPEDWGLLVGTRRLRTVRQATRVEHELLPHRVHTTIARHALKTADKYYSEECR